MAGEQATIVVESSWRSSRRAIPVFGEVVIGDSNNDLDVGEPAFAVVDCRDGTWRVRPCSRDVELDGESLREETVLRHGQRIGTDRARLLFLLGDRERVLDEERHLRTSIDGLTGLLRRNFLWLYLGRQVQPTAVLLIDIDRMKNINDTFGMMGGDRTLRRTASRLRGEVAWPDCIVRIGGEEFVVVLPGATQDEAVARAERIRVACEPPFAFDDESITATVSIGVAMLGGDIAEVLRAADDAMVEAKRNGRNRVSVRG